jgi:hypothetical protein
MRQSACRAMAVALIVFAAVAVLIAQDQTPLPSPAGPSRMQERRERGPRAFGAITTVGVDRFEIKKMDGSTQTIMVDDQTRYQEGQQQIQLEDLKPGDRVMIRGRMNDQRQFVAVQVRRITNEQMQGFRNAGERAFGEIVSIDKNQIKVRNPREGERTIVVNDQTEFIKDGQAIALKDLKTGDRIFARGKVTEGQFVATRVVTGRFRGPWRRRPEP